VIAKYRPKHHDTGKTIINNQAVFIEFVGDKNQRLANSPTNDKSNHNEKMMNVKRAGIVWYENGCKKPPVNKSYL